MDETTKMTDDAGNKKKPKLKRIVKKKPKFHLNSSINSSLYAKNVTIHKNNISEYVINYKWSRRISWT